MYLVKDWSNDFEAVCNTLEEIEELKSVLCKAFAIDEEDAEQIFQEIHYKELKPENLIDAYKQYLIDDSPLLL